MFPSATGIASWSRIANWGQIPISLRRNWNLTPICGPPSASACARSARSAKPARSASCKARAARPFANVEDLALRAQLDLKDLNALAAADALRSLAGHRRQQVWEASAQQKAPGMLRDAPIDEQQLLLPAAKEGEEIFFDYSAMGFTLRRHPVALLRSRLARLKLLTARELDQLPHNRRAAACGLVTVRQQPQTANGTIFVTLEDETGPVNVIVWKHVRERQREALLHSKLMAVRGVWQRDVDSGGQVKHLIAEQLEDLTPLLGRLGGHRGSRDFH
jgi:error-prone DNA polymerase